MKRNNILKTTAIASILFFSGSTFAAGCLPYNPLKNQRITSLFGWRFHPVHKVMKEHKGIDFAGQKGDPIYAPFDGTIAHADVLGTGLAGLTVTIAAADGRYTATNMHLNKKLVNKGQVVKAGDVIGEVGNSSSGGKVGVHLHFQVLDRVYNKLVDPKALITNATLLKDNIAKDFVGMPKNTTYPLPNMDPAGSACNGVSPTPPDLSVHPEGTTPEQMASSDPEKSLDSSGMLLPPIQNFPTMENLSLREFIGMEMNKRFGNSQWHQELDDPAIIQRQIDKHSGVSTIIPANSIPDPTIYLLREINILLSLRNLLSNETYAQKEGIEAKRAALLSLDVKNYADSILKITRSQIAR